MTPAHDICLIDDDADQRRLIGTYLERQNYTWIGAADGQAGFEMILQHRPKVVVCDLLTPGMNGLDLLHQVRDHPDVASTYFLMITSANSPERRFHALESGADDYLVKPIDYRELGARLRVGVRVWQMQDRLRQAAIKDGLTGLYNHDHLNRIVEAEWRRACRYGAPLSFVMIDIDYFKAVNDTFGHLTGNEVLERISVILRNNIREADALGRFGGDEFAIVAPETALADAQAMAERIRLGVCEQLHVAAIRDQIVTASLGVASSEDRRVHAASDLVALADRALYVAKRMGRNRVGTALEVGDADDDPAESIQTEEVETLRRRLAHLSTQAKEVYIQSIGSLIQALEEKDPFSARHSMNVSYYAEQIALQLGCSEALAISIRNAGLLHDIGKVGIPDRILTKPSALSTEEKQLIQQVPLISTRIIDHLRILESEMQIIRHQREYYDGSGRPAGLRGEQIPIGSRIVLVADAFDAMTTERAYRAMSPVDAALAELQRCAGSQFDPRMVTAIRQLAQQNARTWQKRIDETVRALRMAVAAT